MPANRLTPAQREEARRLYTENTMLTVRDLAASYGVGRGTMARALEGVARSNGEWRRVSMSTATMIEMRDAGITLEQIGKQAGISKSGVLRRIQRAEGRK